MIVSKKIISLTLLLLLLTSPFAWSLTSTNKFWVPFTLNGNYGSLFYFVEPQFRIVEPRALDFNQQNNIFNQFLGNYALGFEIYPEWKLWLGQTITTVAQDAVEQSREEYRIFEQLTWQHRTPNHMYLESRFRSEQRKSLDFPQWAFRIRERLIIQMPLTSILAYEVGNEILYNLNAVPWIDTTAWDQNRLYLAFVQTFSVHYAFAMGYMNQYLFRDKPHAQSNNVLYLNIRYNLPE